MSNISPNNQACAFTLSALLNATAPFAKPAPEADNRVKRSLESQPLFAQPSTWTLQPIPTRSAEASSTADRKLKIALGTQALRNTVDRRVYLAADTTIFPLYDAYRRAFNTPELTAWFLSKGMALSTVVVKPGSVSGSVTRDGVTSVQIFTTGDASGWWQASARLRAAAQGLDPEGMGLPYASANSTTFSRNALLRWYGVQPATSDGDLTRVQHELSRVDWSTPTPAKQAERERRVQTARNAIGALDERAHLANILTQRIADRPDDETVTLAELQVQVSSTCTLARNDTGTVAIGDALQSHGLPLPKTAGEMRNAVRWLSASLPPAPSRGNYAHLLAEKWSPGLLSAADRTFLVELNDDEDPGNSGAFNLLRLIDVGGILGRNTPETLRTQADHFLELMLGDPVALLWGDTLAYNRYFHGASGTTHLSDPERAQWVIAAIKLQFALDAPGPPGTVAGYDLYKPGNSGRSMASVRADVETLLKQNSQLDPKAAPLVAHLFLASAAPEFLVRDIPPTLRIGSPEWADLRLGVAFAERQGGAGCSRAMSYQEIMALTRLDPRTAQEAAVLDSYGVDVLLDWGLMQGLYAKPAGGRYTPQQYQQATDAFDAQRKQLIQALKVFNVAPPTREDVAITQLQKVFTDLSVQQLKALRVHIADPNERRNMKPSEPKTRALIETYMTGDLTEGRWMLLAPGEQAPQPPKQTAPFGFNRALSATQQAAVDENVRALNARIASLPDLQALLPGEVDTYLDNLKHALNATTRRIITDLPLADRQALELGSVELFALRGQIDNVPTVEQTPEQVEARRGRKGTLIRCDYNSVVSYFEVFPDKLLIVKRQDLMDQLTLGGTLQDHPKTYGPWAPTITQLHTGAVEPFDFKAYSSSALPVPGATSAGIIIEKLGDTLAPPLAPAQSDAATFVPNSFSSARTQSIVDRIMQGNFIHHRDSLLKFSRGELPLEQRREVSRHNDRILLGMIPFVGAIMELAKGNVVEGTRGLIIDTVGALVGGAGSTLRSLFNATKVIAPFGAKAFRVLEKGVAVVSGFLNPLDGTADLLVGAARGITIVPKLLNKAPKPSVLTALGAVEEKLRVYLGVQSGLNQSPAGQDVDGQPCVHNGHNYSVPVQAVQVDGRWYATNRKNGLRTGTPMDGYQPLSPLTA